MHGSEGTPLFHLCTVANNDSLVPLDNPNPSLHPSFYHYRYFALSFTSFPTITMFKAEREGFEECSAPCLGTDSS